MYCPYCKAELLKNNGELYCKVGTSSFSKHIEMVFEDKITNLKKEKALVPKDENEGHFFCVNCGSKMIKIESMHEVCKDCGFAINKSMYYEIIEKNPHCSY